MSDPNCVNIVNFENLFEENLRSAKNPNKKEELRNYISEKLGIPSQVVDKKLNEMLKKSLLSGFLNNSKGKIVTNDEDYNHVKYYLCKKCLNKYSRSKKLFRKRSSRAQPLRKLTKNKLVNSEKVINNKLIFNF